jgi:hypothetical protein
MNQPIMVAKVDLTVAGEQLRLPTEHGILELSQVNREDVLPPEST